MTPKRSTQIAVAAAVAIYATYFVGVLVMPELAARLMRIEGPIEQAGHFLLAAGIAAFAIATVRARGAPRALGAGFTLYLVLVFMDEIDWGYVYEIDLGWQLLVRHTGHPNMHHFFDTESVHVLGTIVWALPMLFFFGLGLFTRAARFDPVRPQRPESIVFIATTAISTVLDAVPLLDWRLGRVEVSTADGATAPAGAFQMIVYTIVLTVALRAARERS